MGMSEAMRYVLNTRWMWLAAGVLLGLVLAGSGLTAQEQAATAAPLEDTMAVYLSAHGGKDSAQEINKACKAYAPAGWHFADMEPYLEDGDQKGVWVTFVKPALP
jgi:hypothetical protein